MYSPTNNDTGMGHPGFSFQSRGLSLFICKKVKNLRNKIMILIFHFPTKSIFLACGNLDISLAYDFR